MPNQLQPSLSLSGQLFVIAKLTRVFDLLRGDFVCVPSWGGYIMCFLKCCSGQVMVFHCMLSKSAASILVLTAFSQQLIRIKQAL